MRTDSIVGQIVAVVSRRSSAFRLAPDEPLTFPGRLRALLGRSRRHSRTTVAAVAVPKVDTGELGPVSVGRADATALADAATRAIADPSAGTLRAGEVRKYVVVPREGRQRDSLWDIAERYLGSGTRCREIFELNQDRLQPDGERLTLESLVRPGWILIMPADARGEGLIEVTAGTQPLPPFRPTPLRRLAPAGPRGTTGAQVGAGELPGHDSLAQSAGLGAGPAQTAPGPGAPAPTAAAHGGGLSRVVLSDAEVRGQEAAAPERAPNIPWDIVGAELLAAGVLEALIAMRRRRARERMAGAGVALPDAEAAGVEVAVRLGADAAGADFLDRALRMLAAGLAEQDRPVPEIYAARL
ncbi:MAG: hypothetical protein V7637_4346, partial [Mycobacteriales bacterium]